MSYAPQMDHRIRDALLLSAGIFGGIVGARFFHAPLATAQTSAPYQAAPTAAPAQIMVPAGGLVFQTTAGRVLMRLSEDGASQGASQVASQGKLVLYSYSRATPTSASMSPPWTEQASHTEINYAGVKIGDTAVNGNYTSQKLVFTNPDAGPPRTLP